MTFYAIRQISTGWFLPQTRCGRGYTQTSPERDCIPRLHHSLAGARQALSWWLDGKWVSDGDGSPYRVRDQDQPFRDDNDMEIVEVDVQIIRPFTVHVHVTPTLGGGEIDLSNLVNHPITKEFQL